MKLHSGLLPLLCVVALCIGVVSAQLLDVVPIQSEFTLVVAGSQWSRVLFRLGENNSDDASPSPHTVDHAAIGDVLTQMLVTTLRPSPHSVTQPSVTGITAVFLTRRPFASNGGLQTNFAVVRMMGPRSLAPDNAELIAQVQGGDTAMLRSIYISNGGGSTENIEVQSVQAFNERSAVCGKSCVWAVGIVAPLFVTALLLIPAFMSIVHLEGCRGVREYFLVMGNDNEDEQQLSEFADCEDWGPLELVDPDILRQQEAEKIASHMDGIVVLQHITDEENATTEKARKGR